MKYVTQTCRDLYGDALLVLTWMSSNMADGNQRKHLLQKREFILRETRKTLIKSNTFSDT